MQPDLPFGLIPQDPDLRTALVRLACRAEGSGPAGMGIDADMPDGRRAWQELERAFCWIYDYAIEPDTDPRGRMDDAAATVDG
jgi:hypothetical protein